MGAVDSSNRPMRQIHLEQMKQKGISALRLVREPDNIYDSNAIAIHADYGLGDVQLGYVQNRHRVCVGGGHEVRDSSLTKCPICGAELVREGLATELAHWMDAGIEFKARILCITGGGDGRSLGCNISIDRVES